MKLLLAACLLALSAQGALAADAVDRTKPPGPSGKGADWAPPAMTTWAMKNGITVWYLRQDQAPLLSLRLMLPNGAASDPDGQAGLTALMVDMLDEGAGQRSALELSEAFQRLATDYEAYPATDGVVLGMDLLADQLDPSLALLADVLRRPRLPEDEFARRKAQRIAAALANEAEPGYGAQVVAHRVLFGQGYSGRMADGVRSTLEGLTLDMVKARYAQVVQPKGAVLIAVGAVDRETLTKALEKHLGDWQGAPTATALRVSDAPAPRGIYWVDYPGSAQSVVVVARRVSGSSSDSDEYFPATIFNRVIGGAFTSRLNLNLREDKGYTYGARSSFDRNVKAGVFSLSAKVRAETTRASLDEMLNELKQISGKKPIEAKERDEAVNGLMLGFPGRFESMANVASQAVSMALDRRPVDWLNHWPKNLGAVTLADAQGAARAEGKPDGFLVIIAGDHAKLAASMDGIGLPVHLYDAQGAPVANQ
ncbi:MAG: insulinase family protein [Myxococcales bacterium]|nr:insulinase family protein [Myxococcales bacterium]